MSELSQACQASQATQLSWTDLGSALSDLTVDVVD